MGNVPQEDRNRFRSGYARENTTVKEGKKGSMAIFSKLAEGIEEVDVIIAGGKVEMNSTLHKLTCRNVTSPCDTDL